VLNEELQFDIVKETVEDGIGQSKQNKNTSLMYIKIVQKLNNWMILSKIKRN